MRLLLAELGTERAQFYRPHDLRRGHAEDLRREGSAVEYLAVVAQHVCSAGAPVWKILAAGEWRSPALLSYLDVHKMEVEMVLQGCLDEEFDCPEESSEFIPDQAWLSARAAGRNAGSRHGSRNGVRRIA